MGAVGESSLIIGGGDEVNVNIRCSNGSKFTVQTRLESKVQELKAVLAQSCDVPAEQQRLIHKGRILKDEQTLVSYGLQADQTIHMVRGSAPASSLPSNGTASAGNETSTTSDTLDAGPNGGDMAASLGASLFPGLGLSAVGGNMGSGLFGAGVPDFELIQQQLIQNPNMMREIMNLPAMQSLLNNREIIHSLIPQISDIIGRNPELGHILNDPNILQQTLEFARNPEQMREMMWNTDRAMSNIETSSEGFNMLRRMYENVQETFLNAAAMGNGTATGQGSNLFTALLQNQRGDPQTLDGSNFSTHTGSNMATGTAIPNSNPLPNPWPASGGDSQANNASSVNPTGDARQPDVDGLGGLGFPGLEHMVGMQDPSSLNQLLQNPVVSQMMQSLLSNPQYMDQILSFNPQLHSMLEMNPRLREMMQNPEILGQSTSPEMMQQMMGLQRQLSQLREQQSTRDGAQSGQNTAGTTSNMGLDVHVLMNMLGGLGTGSFTAPSTPVSPEELYPTQLSQLQEMGFFDTQENIRALGATSGNVNAAIEHLLGNPGT